MGEYDTQAHLCDKDIDPPHEVCQSIRKLFDSYEYPENERVMIGGMYLIDWDKWASYFGPNLDGFHLPYSFGLLEIDWTEEALRDLLGAIEEVATTGAWPTWVIGNHDEPGVGSRLGTEQGRAAMAIRLTLRGTPTLYYGDERFREAISRNWRAGQLRSSASFVRLKLSRPSLSLRCLLRH